MTDSRTGSVEGKGSEPVAVQASLLKPQEDRLSVYASDTDIESAAAQQTPRLNSVLKAKDPNIVDWDGDDDPEKALNWPSRKKWTYIILLSTLTLLTYVLSISPAIQCLY
jgi:hypothetical protein